MDVLIVNPTSSSGCRVPCICCMSLRSTDPPLHLLSTTIEDTLYYCDADDVVLGLLNMILAWIPFPYLGSLRKLEINFNGNANDFPLRCIFKRVDENGLKGCPGSCDLSRHTNTHISPNDRHPSSKLIVSIFLMTSTQLIYPFLPPIVSGLQTKVQVCSLKFNASTRLTLNHDTTKLGICRHVIFHCLRPFPSNVYVYNSQ